MTREGTRNNAHMAGERFAYAPQAEALAQMTPAFNAQGLICAIAQQYDTGEVLMVAWMDAEALRRTQESGRATYWSRSRQEYWVKGEVSGHVQKVRDLRIDCDGDAVLLLVDQHGPACHTGTRSCFDGRIPAVDSP
jgi:phosphoribosyl-AMP cyclohydrolase